MKFRCRLTGIFLSFLSAAALAQEVGNLPPDPERTTVTDVRKFSWGAQHTAGLHRCFIRDDVIVCLFVITNIQGGDARDFTPGDAIGTPRLIDNFRIEHKVSRTFYLNGRGQQQERINLAQNEKAWFVVEFEGAEKDITTARIVADGAQFGGHVGVDKP